MMRILLVLGIVTGVGLAFLERSAGEDTKEKAARVGAGVAPAGLSESVKAKVAGELGVGGPNMIGTGAAQGTGGKSRSFPARCLTRFGRIESS